MNTIRIIAGPEVEALLFGNTPQRRDRTYLVFGPEQGELNFHAAQGIGGRIRRYCGFNARQYLYDDVLNDPENIEVLLKAYGI